MCSTDTGLAEDFLTSSDGLCSAAFFSKENIQIIQNAIKAGVYKLSNGNFVVGNQNEDTLKIIMRSIYLERMVELE